MDTSELINVQHNTMFKWYGDLSGIKRRLQIPEMYQRTYAWNKEDCDILWDDFAKLIVSEENNPEPHYLGTILLSQEETNLIIEKNIIPHKIVTDGQQRLTSISLLIKAILDELQFRVNDKNSSLKKNRDLEIDLELALYYTESTAAGRSIPAEYNYNIPLLQTSAVNAKEYNYFLSYKADYLINNYLEGTLRFKDTLIGTAYTSFRRSASELKNEDFKKVAKALNNLVVVFIEAKPSQLQSIFETANSLGVDLSVSELAKNYITIGLGSPQVAEKLYNDYWKFLDTNFNIEPETKIELSNSIYYYLAVKTIPNKELQNKYKIDAHSDRSKILPFRKENSNEVYKSYKSYLSFLAINQGSKIKAYESFSKDFNMVIRIIMAIKEFLGKSPDSFIKGVSSYALEDTLNILIKKYQLDIDETFLYETAKIYFVLDDKPLGSRLMSLYWILQNRNIFIDKRTSKNKEKGTFIKTVSRFIIAYLFRAQLLRRDGYGGGQETILIQALDKALQDSSKDIKSKNPKEFMSIFINSLINGPIKNQNFMLENSKTKINTEINEKVTYLSKTSGQAFILKFLVLLADYDIRKNRPKNDTILWMTKGVSINKGKTTIEHIYPQIDDLWNQKIIETFEEKETLINSLGNLTLLISSENSFVQNGTIAYKLKFYEGLSILNDSIRVNSNPDNINVNIFDNIQSEHQRIIWNKNTILSRRKEINNKIIEILLPDLYSF